MQTFLAAAEIPESTVFSKSSRSASAGHCIELAAVRGRVALRHSKAPEQGAFLFSRAELTAFLQGARDGDFDHLS